MIYLSGTHIAIINAMDSITTYKNLQELFDKFHSKFNCSFIYKNEHTGFYFNSQEELFLFLMEWS